MEEKARLIKPEWYGTLEFIAEQLTENGTIDLANELCRGYFEAKSKWEDKFYTIEEFYEYLDNFHLASKLIGSLNPSQDKLPVEFLNELFFLTIEMGFFWGFDGKAKTYIYRHLSFKEKEALTKEIIFKGYSEGRPKVYVEGRDETFINFKFDFEGTGFVLNELSKDEDCCYQFHISPKELANYLKKEERVTDLLLDYLNSTKPNKDYVAEVVVGLGEGLKVIKPLFEELRRVTPKSIIDLDREGRDYIENMIKILAGIGESAFPAWKSILNSPRSKEKTYVVEVLKMMKQKGNQNADSLLKEFISEKEYVRRCILKEDWRSNLEDYWSLWGDLNEQDYIKLYDKYTQTHPPKNKPATY